MKDGIHPNYVECTITCTCGAVYRSRSTKPSIHVDICAGCHPFFTGKAKFVDTAGRVDKFFKKYGDDVKAKKRERRPKRVAAPVDGTEIEEEEEDEA